MSIDAVSSLWSFALDRYARPGAEADCLELQDDHGWDVCELLWIAWLSEQGLRPAAVDSKGLADARAWQREMTAPLRERRRQLKSDAHRHPRLESLRQTLKQAELLSEREMLARLAMVPTATTQIRDPLELALSVCRELRDTGAGDYPLLRRLLARWTIGSSDAEPKPTC